MEKYFKNIDGEYLVSISTGSGMEEITQEEYEHILSVIHSRPADEPGYTHKLRTDLTWEQVALPPEPEDPEISEKEALAIILGGEV